MSNLLSTIMLVFPGIVAGYLARMVGPSESRPATDFEKTVAGLMLSFPGILIAWGASSIGAQKTLSFKEFESGILQMPSFIVYMFLVFLTALLTALLWENNGRQILFNWSSKNRSGRRPNLFYESPWEQFVGTEKEAIIKIYPLNEKESAITGALKSSWTPGEQDKGMLLKCTDEFCPWGEWLEKPSRTYIDTVNKVVYEFFPPSAFEDAKRRVLEQESEND